MISKLPVQPKQSNNGFALLLTLIVISVVLAIGLSLLNITVKQFTLSSTIRDSEIAFHAANTGVECLQYAINQNQADYFDGDSAPSVTCGDYSSVTGYPDDDHPSSVSNGDLYKYEYRFNKAEQCIDISVYSFDVGDSGDMSYSFSDEGLATGECSLNGQCTYMFSRGYNRSCSDLASLRVVQREIAVDF